VNLWLQGKRSHQRFLFLRDKESTLKWNAVILWNIKKFLILPQQFTELDYAITGLVNAVMYYQTQLPSIVFVNQLWNSLKVTKISEKEKAMLKDLLEASIIFQVILN